MEILDQIEGKINQAMQTIEELQARVLELEEQKQQYESKLSSLLKHLDRFGEPNPQTNEVTVPQVEPINNPPANSNTESHYPQENNNTENHHF